MQLGKPLEQASQRVCALQGTVQAGLEAAAERLLAASRAEAEQEVHACTAHRRARHLSGAWPRAVLHAPQLAPQLAPRFYLRAPQARRVPELEESVRQLEVSLSATEEELRAARAAAHSGAYAAQAAWAHA